MTELENQETVQEEVFNPSPETIKAFSQFKLEEVSTETTEEVDEHGNPKSQEQSSQNKNTETVDDNDDDDSNDDGGNKDDAPTKPLEILFKDYGIDKEDERFKDLDLNDDSVEAIKKFYEIRETSIKDSGLKELLESDEDISSLLQWKLAGKSAASWKALKQAEALPTEIDKTNLVAVEQIVRNNYEKLGITGKKLDAMIEALKDGDELVTEAESLVNKNKQEAIAKANAIAKQEELDAAEAEKEEKEILANIANTIKKGTLSNRITIPEAERKAFHQHIVTDARAKAYDELSLEDKMLVDYIIYKKFDLKGLQVPVKKVEVRTPVVIKSDKSQDHSEIGLDEAITRLRKNHR